MSIELVDIQCEPYDVRCYRLIHLVCSGRHMLVDHYSFRGSSNPLAVVPSLSLSLSGLLMPQLEAGRR